MSSNFILKLNSMLFAMNLDLNEYETIYCSPSLTQQIFLLNLLFGISKFTIHVNFVRVRAGVFIRLTKQKKQKRN